MKTSVLILLALTFSFSFNSCKKDNVFCRDGKGLLTTLEYGVNNFDGVEINIPAEVHIHHAAEYHVEVEAYDNLFEALEVEISGKTLEFNKEKCFKTDRPLKVTIFTPELNSLKVTSSANVFMPDERNVSSFQLYISGSGTVTGAVNATNTMSTSISGSGNADFTGACRNQHIDISGTGNYNSFEMISEESHINISGTGNCEITATKLLDVNISGSGNIYYKTNGNDIQMNTVISGSGKLVKQE